MRSDNLRGFFLFPSQLTSVLVARTPSDRSIKGNVKENTCPSTESGEELRDFQPILAMKAASDAL
jgi:hypothetical protein